MQAAIPAACDTALPEGSTGRYMKAFFRQTGRSFPVRKKKDTVRLKFWTNCFKLTRKKKKRKYFQRLRSSCVFHAGEKPSFDRQYGPILACPRGYALQRAYSIFLYRPQGLPGTPYKRHLLLPGCTFCLPLLPAPWPVRTQLPSIPCYHLLCSVRMA